MILKGLRVVAPQTLHKEYLRQFLKGHPGIDATKRRARETVYWTSLMLDIDCDITPCQPCSSAQPHQQKEPLLIHLVPDLSWSFVSADIIRLKWTGVPDTRRLLLQLV